MPSSAKRGDSRIRYRQANRGKTVMALGCDLLHSVAPTDNWRWRSIVTPLKKLARAAEYLSYSLTPGGVLGGKPPQKSGFRRHLAGQKCLKRPRPPKYCRLSMPHLGTS